jgi:metal-responsive CopG/Arc/MetJ family transcriptional regulator
MAAISIALPDSLAEKSQAVAKALHISRAHFIRMALEHEIHAYTIRQEQEALAGSFQAMKKNKLYLAEAEALMIGLNADYSDEGEGWWKK